MDSLSTALFSLCATFDTISDEQLAEEKRRAKMEVVVARLEVIDKEIAEIARSPLFSKAAKSLEESEEADELRKKLRTLQKEKSTLEAERAAAPPTDLAASRAAEEEGSVDPWAAEAIQALNVMLSSSSREVQLRACVTISRLAEKNAAAKHEICQVKGISDKIVTLMRAGGLEAIETISVLTEHNLKACDLMRFAGATLLLSQFINTENETDPSAGKVNKVEHDADKAAESAEGDRPLIVPVRVKALAVSALRNIATSTAENLDHITQLDTVIPQLVQLMTKMNDQSNDNASSAGGSSKGSGGSQDSEKRQKRKNKLNSALKEKMEAELLDRKQLAKDNRKLAESAGQMLHTMIVEGRTEVKKIIISAIIAQVQQPGSVPPEDVPALMTILKSTAEEQLTLVQKAEDHSALQAALQFGRW